MSRLSTKQRRSARRRHARPLCHIDRSLYPSWWSEVTAQEPLTGERFSELLEQVWRILRDQE